MLLYSFGNRLEDLLEENPGISKNARVACNINGELRYLENDYFDVSVVDGELKYVEDDEREDSIKNPYNAYFTTHENDKRMKKKKGIAFETIGGILDSTRWNCNCCAYKREKEDDGYDNCGDDACAILVSNLNSKATNYEKEVVHHIEDVKYDSDLGIVVLGITTEKTY